MAYINEPYKFVYIARNFTAGLPDVKLVVYKPDMTKLGVYNLIEIDAGDGRGIYYYDFTDADIPGVYTFVCNSASCPLKDARTLYFDSRVAIAQSLLSGTVEGWVDVQEAIQIMLAVLAGKASGGNTDTVIFRNITNTMDKVTATVDSLGNRHSVIITP